MLTRELIVQRLLEEKQITTEEAVTLLKTEVTKWLPAPSTTPWIGPGPTVQPYTPSTPSNPTFPYCDWTYRPENQPFYGYSLHTGTGIPNNFSYTTSDNLCAK